MPFSPLPIFPISVIGTTGHRHPNLVAIWTQFPPHPVTEHFWNSSFCSTLAAPTSAQTLTISPQTTIPETSQLALGFLSLQLQPHLNTAAKVIFLKQNLIVTSLFRIFVFQIKYKILPRTYKVLYYLASDYLPCFIWGHAPHISHEANRATWKFPNSASLSAQNAILSFAHLANSHSFFLYQLKTQKSSLPCSLGFHGTLHFSLL